jgi:heterodisulfide reductase subunit B2
MDFSYYPGCTLKGSAQELDESFRAAASRLGISLRELPDWSCCGASSAHMVDPFLETALPAKDLLTAERIGRDVVVPCAGCHVRMKAAARAVTREKELHRRFPFQGEIRVIAGMELFAMPEVRNRLKESGANSLKGLRVVPYYGCYAVRPVEVVEPEDAENPTLMDRVLQDLGAEVLSWPCKTDCCGGSLALTRTDLVLKLSGRLLDMALLVEADAIVTFCPMCQANLDTRQAEISQRTGKLYHMPVLFLTELMGVAFGEPHVGNWLKKHMISPGGVLTMRGLG